MDNELTIVRQEREAAKRDLADATRDLEEASRRTKHVREMSQSEYEQAKADALKRARHWRRR
jgi:hypothetical protein